MSVWWSVLTALAAAALIALVWRLRGRGSRQLARRHAAAEQFQHERSELEAAFLAAAGAAGRPRGLRWVASRLDPSTLFAVEPSTGALFALVGATISFEAIEGGGMEDVEAVGNLRYATAVFVHRDGRWTTEGRAIFNLEPAQALERFGSALEPLPPAPS